MDGAKCTCGGVFTWICHLLVVVGALNWGLVAINPEWNVVNMVLGSWPVVERVVYGLVGVAGLWMLVKLFTGCSCKKA